MTTNPDPWPGDYTPRDAANTVLFRRQLLELIDRPCMCSRGLRAPADCARQSLDAYTWRPNTPTPGPTTTENNP